VSDGKSLHGSVVWSHDGKRIAFYGNDRDGVSFDVYVADIAAGGAPRLIIGGGADTWYPLDWSVDDRKLLVWKYYSISESYLYIADTVTGALTPLDKSKRKIGIRSAKFAPDGRGVYVVSDEDGEFAQLHYVDTVTHESRKLTSHIPWDIESFDASSDGRYLAYVANADGISRLTVVDNTQKRELIPPGIPDGHIYELRFDRSGRRLAFSAETAQTPRDVYVYDLQSNARRTLDPQRGGARGCAHLCQRRAYPLSDLGSRRRTAAAHLRLSLSTAHQRSASGHHQYSRRA
jgi:dipeptidyl aminopeptidase/acylaminoacyl peptidase